MKFWLIMLFLISCLVTAVARDPVKGAGLSQFFGKLQIDGDNLVHFGDTVDVDVVGGFDFDWRGTLTPEGFLDGFDANVEPIYALCRSESQIAADITKILGRTLRNPAAVVKIIDRSGRAVARLDGGVRTPTRFRLRRAVNLRELLVMAGGISDGASGEISVFRPKNLSCIPAVIQPGQFESATVSTTDNASITMSVKIVDLLSGKESSNPQIFSGDIVTVTRALPIYVIGAVNNPRPIYSREKMTVSRIVATAGGLAKDADGSKVSIYRREGLDVRSVSADLGKIKRGESEDEILRPFDIVEVEAKGSGKRKYPPVVANDDVRDRSNQVLPLRIVD